MNFLGTAGHNVASVVFSIVFTLFVAAYLPDGDTGYDPNNIPVHSAFYNVISLVVFSTLFWGMSELIRKTPDTVMSKDGYAWATWSRYFAIMWLITIFTALVMKNAEDVPAIIAIPLFIPAFIISVLGQLLCPVSLGFMIARVGPYFVIAMISSNVREEIRRKGVRGSVHSATRPHFGAAEARGKEAQQQGALGGSRALTTYQFGDGTGGSSSGEAENQGQANTGASRAQTTSQFGDGIADDDVWDFKQDDDMKNDKADQIPTIQHATPIAERHVAHNPTIMNSYYQRIRFGTIRAALAEYNNLLDEQARTSEARRRIEDAEHNLRSTDADHYLSLIHI